jgi:hypothetical protein
MQIVWSNYFEMAAGWCDHASELGVEGATEVYHYKLVVVASQR